MSALGETLMTAFCLSGLAAGCLVLLPRTPPRLRFALAAAAPASSGLPATPAGDALGALLRAANACDSEFVGELLGAYTPQEVALPLPRSAGIRVIEVSHSDPLRIQYVVESGGGVRHVGELAVSNATPTQITATRLRPLN